MGIAYLVINLNFSLIKYARVSYCSCVLFLFAAKCNISMNFYVFCRDCGKQVYLGEKINFNIEFRLFWFRVIRNFLDRLILIIFSIDLCMCLD